ncbi:AraC family transcriptional regulator [Paenibacillus sp.]|uniref:AraC family transcriptional regulator n=1 Tax=Paenibacillus sp. TaxID=58172 RepID=UPI002D224F16|nr:AraC family transcriptional regulator [Paenibacillus sp.]HZG56179.1 AraC family transcriptional regulator [Paenibacillus sp.]
MADDSAVKRIDFLNLAPYVRYIHEYRSDAEYRIPPRIIYDHEIVFMVGGRLTYTVEGTACELRTGDALFLRPHVEHFAYAPEGSELHYYAVHFDLVYMGEQLDFSADDVYANVDYLHLDHIPVEEELAARPAAELTEVAFPAVIRIREPLPCRQALREMLDTFERKPFGYHLVLRSRLLDLLCRMARDAATGDGVRRGAAYRHEVAEAIRYMYEHYGEAIDAGDIPQARYFSPNYFRTLFKEATGKTPLEMLTSIRIEAAKRLMQEGNHTVGAVCRRVGYSDIHYFSKLFKKLEGISPKYYIDSVCNFGDSNK